MLHEGREVCCTEGGLGSGISHNPKEVIRIDRWTYEEEDEVVFCIMRFALIVKVDGFLSEGLVESRSSFGND